MDDNMLDVEASEVRHQLRRILASGNFKASARNRHFLEYVVEETLAGRAERIKAYTIAISVFGRAAGFNPDLDSIVRIEAGRLRRSLEHYYLTAGIDDAFRITIPKGTYVPAFGPTLPLDQPASVPTLPPAATTRAPSGRRSPAVLVMPFEEGGDPSAFSNITRGFTRLLIVGLTRFTDLMVFGSETTLAFGRSRNFVTDFSGDFILTGGTTITTTSFSVEALLIDANTGRSLWAESFERSLDLTQIVRTRNEVASRVVRTLAQPNGAIANIWRLKPIACNESAARR